MAPWYVMVDRPAVKVDGSRHVRYTNKPRREHKSFAAAHQEAKRLAVRTKARALVLEVVEAVTITTGD